MTRHSAAFKALAVAALAFTAVAETFAGVYVEGREAAHA